MTPGRMRRHVTDRAIVAAKDKFAIRSRFEKTQHYGKQLGKVSRYS